jgi:hypothetical protein
LYINRWKRCRCRWWWWRWIERCRWWWWWWRWWWCISRVKQNSNPYTHAHIYIDFSFSFSSNFFFFLFWCVTFNVSVFLSLLMSDWCTIGRSVSWLLDRRCHSLFFFHLCLSTSWLCTFFPLYLIFVLSVLVSHPAVVMYVSCSSCMCVVFWKEENLCLSVLLTNSQDTRKNCVNKKKTIHFLVIMEVKR